MREVIPDTVLAVDDEPLILNLVRVTIKIAGLNPEIFQDPHEALQVYEANAANIPVVVTDRNYKRDDINGDSFAEQIRGIANKYEPPLNVRIIMLFFLQTKQVI